MVRGEVAKKREVKGLTEVGAPMHSGGVEHLPVRSRRRSDRVSVPPAGMRSYSLPNASPGRDRRTAFGFVVVAAGGGPDG